MIHRDSFTKEWIESVKGSERFDAVIIERQIHALHLLESLLKHFDDFIFKGGTSLSLISDDFPRFSVDIDILVNPNQKSYFNEEKLQNIIGHSQFDSVKENVRTPKHAIDKKHFEFTYKTYQDERSYILLDIVFAKSHYTSLDKVEINNYLIKTSEPKVYVSIPSISDLIADKLCAFAPNTTGKHLDEGRDLEVIKQMYDVGFLMDNYPLSPSFHESYIGICKEEISRRNLSITYKDVLIDTISTASNILTEGQVNKKEYATLKKAIRSFTSYTRDYNFNIESAKLTALKNLKASLLVLTQGNEEFETLATSTESFDVDFKIFISTKKVLRRIDFHMYELLNDCLKVMTKLEIALNT